MLLINIHLMMIKIGLALATLAQLVGASSHNQEVVGLISDHGSYQGCGFNPRSRCVQKITDRCFSLSLPVSLKAMKKKMSLDEHQKEKKKKKIGLNWGGSRLVSVKPYTCGHT